MAYSKYVALTVVSVLFLSPDISLGRGVPYSASVATWADGKTAAVSLTFDDGCPSQLSKIAPLLGARGLGATFFLVTGSVRSWSGWSQLKAEGHEIASHTISHRDLTTLTLPEAERELADSRAALQQKLGIGEGATLAYPFITTSAAVEELASRYYLAARSGGSSLVPSNPSSLLKLSAFPWRSQVTASDMNRIVDQAIAAGGWAIEYGHGTDGDGYEPPPSSQYQSHFDYLEQKSNEGQIWVAPMGIVARYILERQAARVVTTQSAAGGEILVTLTSVRALPPEPAPLTLVVPVPAAWEGVDARTSDGAVLTGRVLVRGGQRQVLLPVVPPDPSAEITISLRQAGEATNEPPVVNAGDDRTLNLPEDETALQGHVDDPDSTPTIAWSQVGGPSGAIFDDPSAPDSRVKFPQAGVYVLRLAADDGANPPVSDDVTITVLRENHPPDTTSAPSPPDGASALSIPITLSWSCSDPDADDSLRYDVYLGTSSDPNEIPRVAKALNTPSRTLSDLAEDQIYYWYVVAKDTLGATTRGPLWSFRTAPLDSRLLFRRGDSNDDGKIDLADAVHLLQNLFSGGDPPPCKDAADSDDNGELSVTDTVRTLDYLFRGGAQLPAPGSVSCGEDETPDGFPDCGTKC